MDDPTRFGKSSTVGAYFGLTPKKCQSGETDRDGGVTKVGDAMVRTALFEAAHIMLTRATRFSSLKRSGLEVARRRGMKRARWHSRASWASCSIACRSMRPMLRG